MAETERDIPENGLIRVEFQLKISLLRQVAAIARAEGRTVPDVLATLIQEGLEEAP